MTSFRIRAMAFGMVASPLTFRFDEEKAVEALTYVASRWPGITAFYASKTLFFAEKKHLNRYGRPIVADEFRAMENGPVPSTIYDFVKGDLRSAKNPAMIREALSFGSIPYPNATALRQPDLDALSPSDMECLDEALAFCRVRGFRELSEISHRDPSWAKADLNGPMDYAEMIDDDNPRRDDILEEAREFAAFGVL